LPSPVARPLQRLIETPNSRQLHIPNDVETR
jgi:hypothetical protein